MLLLVALLICNVCVLCRGAGGGNGGVGRVPGTPDQLTDTAGSKDSPDSLRPLLSNDADMSEPMLHEDSMQDPFPQNAHENDENVIYSRMELLDTDRQFRYVLVESAVKYIHEIFKTYSVSDKLRRSLLEQSIQDMNDDYIKALHQMALYVYTNLNTKFAMKGQTEKMSYVEYYTLSGQADRAEWLYVMIFMMRQQQWSQDKFNAYKKSVHDSWEEYMKKPDATAIGEDVLADFENVLLTGDEWINDIIQKEPVAESATKKQRVAKPDRHAIRLLDMIEENKWTDFKPYLQGIEKVSEHFQALYAVEKGTSESMKGKYAEALALKELTNQLYPRTRQMFEMSNFRFKHQYPKKWLQWQYWILRAIMILQVEGDTQVWYGYLNHANGIVTDRDNPVHLKPSSAEFPLQADFDSLEPDVKT
jgi:hypothetical protein